MKQDTRCRGFRDLRVLACNAVFPGATFPVQTAQQAQDSSMHTANTSDKEGSQEHSSNCSSGEDSELHSEGQVEAGHSPEFSEGHVEQSSELPAPLQDDLHKEDPSETPPSPAVADTSQPEAQQAANPVDDIENDSAGQPEDSDGADDHSVEDDASGSLEDEQDTSDDEAEASEGSPDEDDSRGDIEMKEQQSTDDEDEQSPEKDQQVPNGRQKRKAAAAALQNVKGFIAKEGASDVIALVGLQL